MTTRTHTKALTLLALATMIACKPQPISRAFETGGEPAAFRLTSTLNGTGDLRLERTATTAAATTPKFTRVDLVTATSPAGQITRPRLVAKKWLAMTEGAGDLTFNVLMGTDTGGSTTLCYVNGSRLNGTSEPVFCKPTSAAGAAEDPAKAAKNLQTQRETCQRLAALRIPPDQTTAFARVDAANDAHCVCLNGRERSVRYDLQKGKESQDAGQAFEALCLRKEPQTEGGVLSASDRNYNACVELGALATWRLGRSDVSAGGGTCACGDERLAYGDMRFDGDPKGFERECRQLAKIKEPLPSPTSSPTTLPNTLPNTLPDSPPGEATVRSMQAACIDRGYYDKGTYCDCRDDGIEVMRTAGYKTYGTLESFKGDLDLLLCD